MAKTILLRDYDGSEYSTETPLSCKVDLVEVKDKLGIPDFVNTRSFLIERALVTLWAAVNASKTHETWPDIIGNFGPGPIPLLLFGGGAVRMHSSSSNQPASPFCRNLKDLDFIVPKNRGRDLIRLLTNLGEMLGSRYHHFVSTSDRAFNAMRGGNRYRIRTIDSVNEDGTPLLGMLDVMTDTVDLRHRVDVREDFENPARNMYTISLENFLLTKCQYIFEAPGNVLRQLKDTGFDYRVLNYPFLKSERIVIGMEEKDIRDVCAILADNPVGENPGSISPAKIKLVLERDKKFALTFRLNIQNLVDKSESLERLQFGRSTISKILEGANEILRVIPVVEKKWANPWWNLDVETPKIFGKVGDSEPKSNSGIGLLKLRFLSSAANLWP